MIVELSDNISTKEINIINANSKPPKMMVGTDEFYDLVVNSDVFIDKSLMIKELLEDRRIVGKFYHFSSNGRKEGRIIL